MKRRMDIEGLLRWAYREELVKRVTSSAEDVWGRIRDIGALGGVEVQHGGPQRYDLGSPHPDAVAIEAAVAQLPDASIDWDAEAALVLGDLLALCDPTQDSRTTTEERPTTVAWPTRAGGVKRMVLQPPRRVLLVRTLRTSALVTMHAKMGTRPDWREEPPH